MNIILPENYTYKNRNGEVGAKVDGGILKLYDDTQFKSLMKDVTYAIYGRTHCYYCGRAFKSAQINIDHIIPQDVGGPTISNNLIPSCKNCNNKKTNMTVQMFEEYKKLEKHLAKLSKIEFKEQVEKELEELKNDKDFTFLNGWVSFEKTETIKKKLNGGHWEDSKDLTQRNKAKCAKKWTFYKTYGRFPKAILIDKNGRLLGGYTTLMCAINKKIPIVPVIKLDNVEIVYYRL